MLKMKQQSCLVSMYWQYKFATNNPSTSHVARYYAHQVLTGRKEALEQCKKLRAMINKVRV